MILIDAGTSWCKVLELYSSQNELDSSCINNDLISQYQVTHSKTTFISTEGTEFSGRYFLFPSKLISKTNIAFDKATGHMVKNKLKQGGTYENEIISLACGAKKIIKNLKNATIVDLGSRDAKWVRFKNNKYKDLDWNGNCGSATGATVEMLCKFYDVDTSIIPIQKERIPVTCGVFAMEKIMDEIASDIPADIAIAKYIHGIAYNTWKFAQEPKQIYLSGGFCNNKCFVDSLKLYCDVSTLDRFVLLEGLY